MTTAHERDSIGVQDIIQNCSTSIHDDPASIIAPFEKILLDGEINDDFLRDAIESIAHHYTPCAVVCLEWSNKYTFY